MAIDSYRFVDFATRQIMKAWAGRQEPGVIPFTPLAKPLRDTLFFAGEATNLSGETATVGGALQSGLRAARELIAKH